MRALQAQGWHGRWVASINSMERLTRQRTTILKALAAAHRSLPSPQEREAVQATRSRLDIQAQRKA